MARKDLVAGVLGLLAHSFAWIAHTEQIWMPAIGAYVRWLAPAMGLPDLRGPFLFITLLYIGLRLGDMLNAENKLEENL